MPSKRKLHKFKPGIFLVASGNSNGDTTTGQNGSQEAASFQYHI